MRTARPPRKERQLAAKLLLNNVAREFSIDFLRVVDERQEQVFHLLPTDVYFSNRRIITDLLMECATRQAAKSLLSIPKGKRLFTAVRTYLRIQVALRSGSTRSVMVKTQKAQASVFSSASEIRPIRNDILDFAAQMCDVSRSYDLTFWAAFARELCEDLEDLARPYQLILRPV